MPIHSQGRCRVRVLGSSIGTTVALLAPNNDVFETRGSRMVSLCNLRL